MVGMRRNLNSPQFNNRKCSFLVVLKMNFKMSLDQLLSFPLYVCFRKQTLYKKFLKQSNPVSHWQLGSNSHRVTEQTLFVKCSDYKGTVLYEGNFDNTLSLPMESPAEEGAIST